MRILISVIILAIIGCSHPNRVTEVNGKEKIIFNSGNFSGIDYIMVTKFEKKRKRLIITIDCNHYITGIGYTVFVRKNTYTDKGVYIYTSHLIKDSSAYLGFYYRVKPDAPVFDSFTTEEYDLINRAYIKYPALTRKYKLSADVFKHYLGWFKIQEE